MELRHPHDKLLMQGKKTAILSVDALPVGEPVPVTGGAVVLGEPARMLVSEVDRKEWFERHRVRRAEREAWFPGATRFLVYPVESFQPALEDWRADDDPKSFGVDEKQHTGVMIALFPRMQDATVLAVPGGEPAEDLHVTLALLDETQDRDLLERIVARYAEENGPVAGQINGGGVFVGEQDVLWLNFDAAGLPAFRQGLVERLEAADFSLESEHGFTPHMTLMYGSNIESAPKVSRPLTMDRLVLAIGDDRTVHSLLGNKALFTEPELRETARRVLGGKDPGEALAERIAEQEGEVPYKIEEDGDEFCVVQEDTGEQVACHDTEAEAEAHLAALRINVEAEEKQIDEPLSEKVEPEPEPDIMEESATTTGPMEVQEISGSSDGKVQVQKDDVAVAPEPDEKAGRRVKRPMLQKIKDAFSTLKELLSWAEYEEEEEEGIKLMGETGFAIKRHQGQDWIWTWTTNAFKDRDREIFSTKGLERYVEEADRTGERGRYNLWHVKGTEFADVRVQGVMGRFLVEGGPFSDTPLGQAAKRFFRKYPAGHPEHAPDGWGCSPEFRYLQKERDTGIFDNFWITDRAILPRWAAANVQTKAGGSIMALTQKQEALFKEALGEDEFTKLVQAAEKETEDLEESLDFKAWDAKKVCKRLRGMADKADDKTKATLESLASEIEGGDEEDDEEKKEIDLEALAGELAKHFDVDIHPLVEQAEKQAQQIAEQAQEIAALRDLIAEGEKKRSRDLPRFVLGLEKRASEAEETVVGEDDPLMKMGPKEVMPEQKSGAAHFFGAK